MPAQKTEESSPSPPPPPPPYSPPPLPPPPKEEQDDDTKPPVKIETINNSIDNNDIKNEQADDEEDESPPSSPDEIDEFVKVKLSEIRKEVQCPICLGIIRKTRTVMECLHRFCRECIDKAMRLGNNECPACRTHCASRRSLRDDPNYDALIATLYPDIEKYEEEELAFHEEERARNKQIQASIAQTFRRQTEALGKKKTSARATAAAFMRRSLGTYRNLRGRRNQRASEHHDSDDEQDGNGRDGGSKDSSSADERSPEVKPKRYRRRARSVSSEASPAGADVEFDENDSEQKPVGASAGLVGSSEIFTWGRGGMRSNSRHSSLSGNKTSRRVSKLIDHLKSENNNATEISLTLVSLHEGGIPTLQRPFLSCTPMVSIGPLCEYIASQTNVEADKIEMLVVKGFSLRTTFPSSICQATEPITIDPSKHELHTLEEHQVLAEIQSMWTPNEYNLVLAYREKKEGTGN